jgi:hypothetical protein
MFPVYCTVSVVVAADGRTTFCILLRSHPLQSLRAPHRWRSVSRRTQAANGSRHQTSVSVLAWPDVVMLLGKAAETIGVLSLEGSSRRWGTCQLRHPRGRCLCPRWILQPVSLVSWMPILAGWYSDQQQGNRSLDSSSRFPTYAAPSARVWPWTLTPRADGSCDNGR